MEEGGGRYTQDESPSQTDHTIIISN
jgi:hypothetical protein